MRKENFYLNCPITTEYIGCQHCDGSGCEACHSLGVKMEVTRQHGQVVKTRSAKQICEDTGGRFERTPH